MAGSPMQNVRLGGSPRRSEIDGHSVKRRPNRSHADKLERLVRRSNDSWAVHLYAALPCGLPCWSRPAGSTSSEGLLLFSLTPRGPPALPPRHRPPKTYHVHIDRLPDAALLAALDSGRCRLRTPEGVGPRGASAPEQNAGSSSARPGRNRQYVMRKLSMFGTLLFAWPSARCRWLAREQGPVAHAQSKEMDSL